MSKQSGSYLLPGTTCMLAMVRNDSRVHQVELKKEEGKKRKKMSSISYSQERSRPFARSLICSLVRCLSRLIPDCPDVMYKEYPYASCHTQHQGYGDGGIVKLLNHIKAKKKE